MEVNIEVEKASNHKPSLINRGVAVNHGVVVRTWVGPRRVYKNILLCSLDGTSEVSVEDGDHDNCLVTRHVVRVFGEDIASFYTRIKLAMTLCRLGTVKSYGKKYPLIYC